jgi:hypothetical protein
LRLLAATSAMTVLVDGRSGSGKSTLATQLLEGWPDGVLVRMDDVYPGWDGLAWATEHIASSLLSPRSRGGPGRWRSWDWVDDRPASWHTVDSASRLIVEGTGVLTPVSRAMADLAIWVEADDVDRKRRALERDGDVYRPHWERWAAQEAEFIARYDPRACADLIATPEAEGFDVTPVAGAR